MPSLANSSGIAVLIFSLCLIRPAIGALLPTNNDPTNQIRFDTPAEASAKRQQLTNYIWSNGLPTSALPAVTANLGSSIFSGDLNGINQSLVSRVDRLDANVSGFDFHSISYLLTPANTVHSKRLVIVHQGHSLYAGRFEGGVGTTVNALLQQGFSVNVMQMPLFGWNTDTTAIVPGQGTLIYANHDAMINNTGPLQGGMGFRLFLEPVIQSINYFQTLPGLIDVSMTGLSGGGWTTHMVSAIDSRVGLSVPVAGSAPLYVRNSDPSSVGDGEQIYTPLYNENIAPGGAGGGVATWLETYALGGYGSSRQQVMVTNQFDNCCFSGTFADTFKNIVSDRVDLLGQGDWDYFLDSTGNVHQISSNVLSQVLFPALEVVRFVNGPDPSNLVPAPSSLALVLVGLMGSVFFRWRRPRAGFCSSSATQVRKLLGP